MSFYKKISEKLRMTRISTRITVLLVLILIVTFGSYTAFTIYYGQYRSRKALIHQTTFLAKTVERVLRIKMVENLREDLNYTLREIHKDKDIRQIRIYDHTGRIAYSTDSTVVGKKVAMGDYPCRNCHSGSMPAKTDDSPVFGSASLHSDEEELEVNIPIFNEEACSNASCHIHLPTQKKLGLLTIAVVSQRSLAEWRISRTVLMGVGLLVIGLTAVVVYLLLRYWVWKPVQAMVEGTQRIASGNLEEPIPPGQAEIGELAEAFNKMQTRLKDTQQHLLMCEKLASVGKLAAGVAHEINNPLTGILTFSESLLEETPLDDPHRADYEVIRQQSLRSRDIVRKILDFARQDEPKRKYVQINSVIEKTVSLVRRLSQFQNIQIVSRLSNSVPETLVDPGQLEQVILNMLINSSEAISSGGKIEIATSANPIRKEILITISDNGVGIAPENLTRIFDPFFTTKKDREHTNSGLGLSVSWGIIEQHSGRIEVDSQLGRGTTFKIILPIRSE